MAWTNSTRRATPNPTAISRSRKGNVALARLGDQRFNRNQPYEPLHLEQIAGDRFPTHARTEDRHRLPRNHRINSETSSIAEEFQAENHGGPRQYFWRSGWA